MQTKAITFVQPKQAQLLERELGEVSGELVLV